MTTPKPPAGRIRWTDETVNGHLVTAGYAGTFAEAAFRLYGPEGAQERWLLATRLIAGTGFIPADTPDELKAEAERWLTRFVSSLGAVFPDTAAADLRSRAEELGAVVDRRPGAERDKLVFAAPLKRAADLIE